MEKAQGMRIEAVLDDDTTKLLGILFLRRGHKDINETLREVIRFQAAVMGHTKHGSQLILRESFGKETEIKIPEIVPSVRLQER